MTASPVLSASDIFAGYEPGLPIVQGANLSVSAGEIVVVLGPNGAGKSTLIKAIAGLVPKFSGQVVLEGSDITAVPAHRMVHRGLAFVPQTENVFTGLTVEDNLALAAHVLAKDQRASQTAAMFAFFPDLKRQRGVAAGRLSGGQRQMLAIARALMIRPRVLMLDEPSAGLSPRLVDEVFASLAAIRKEGVAIILVEQNAKAALALGDRAVLLVEGRNRYEGAAADLWGDPAIAELYLGIRAKGAA